MAPHAASRVAVRPPPRWRVHGCSGGHGRCPSMAGRALGLCQRQVGWAHEQRDRRRCAHVGRASP